MKLKWIDRLSFNRWRFKYAQAAVISINELSNGAKSITLTVVPDDDYVILDNEAAYRKYIVILTAENLSGTDY